MNESKRQCQKKLLEALMYIDLCNDKTVVTNEISKTLDICKNTFSLNSTKNAGKNNELGSMNEVRNIFIRNLDCKHYLYFKFVTSGIINTVY